MKEGRKKRKEEGRKMYFKVESGKEDIPSTSSIKVRSGGGGGRW